MGIKWKLFKKWIFSAIFQMCSGQHLQTGLPGVGLALWWSSLSCVGGENDQRWALTERALFHLQPGRRLPTPVTLLPEGGYLNGAELRYQWALVRARHVVELDCICLMITRPLGHISHPTQVNVSQSCFNSLNKLLKLNYIVQSGGSL